MNLIISKSKNSKSLYIQKSFRKNGKSTSKVVKKLGTMEELLPKHNNSEDEVIAWGKKIAKKMTEEEKKRYGSCPYLSITVKASRTNEANII